MNLALYLTNVQNLCKIFNNTFNISRDTNFILENNRIKIYTINNKKDMVIEALLDSIIIDNIINLLDTNKQIYSVSNYNLYNITKKLNYFGNCLFEFYDNTCSLSYNKNGKKTTFTIDSVKLNSIYSIPLTTYSCIFTVNPDDFLLLINRCSVVDNDIELSITNDKLIGKSSDTNISCETQINILIYKYSTFKFLYSKTYLDLIKNYHNKMLYMKIYIDDFGLIKISMYIHNLGTLNLYFSPVEPP